MTSATKFTNPSSATYAVEIHPSYGPTVSGGGEAVVKIQTGQFQRLDPRAIEDAVYGHIMAIRALGRTSINTAEIAAALNVSLELVESTIESLRARNVRIAP